MELRTLSVTLKHLGLFNKFAIGQKLVLNYQSNHIFYHIVDLKSFDEFKSLFQLLFIKFQSTIMLTLNLSFQSKVDRIQDKTLRKQSLDFLINNIYYVDEIYSNFGATNTKNDTIYINIAELLKYTNLITEETQNTIVFNENPLILQGKEILWQIKRRTKQILNQQFNIEPTDVDYLIDFIQLESTYLQANPLRFTTDLESIVQQQFNDKTLRIFPKNYYYIQLKNIYKGRYIRSENISSSYSLKFGSYQICSNNTETLQKYQLQCMARTISGKFYTCILQNTQSDDNIIELTCECNKFGDIFLTTSTNFSYIIDNSTSQEIIILSSIQRLKNAQENLHSESHIEIQAKTSLMYPGSTKIFKQKLKLIHQTISIFYYIDKSIKLSYRILEIFSQVNIQLSLVILECFLLNNQILFIFVFIIANPFIILILRIVYKIIEAIYRVKRIASFISQFLLIMLLLTPNLVFLMTYTLKIKLQSDQYLTIIILIGNVVIQQVIIEPLTIYIRIIIYRLIALSMKNMELNPIFHLMHFFVMHSSLEEIFDEFTRI